MKFSRRALIKSQAILGGLLASGTGWSQSTNLQARLKGLGPLQDPDHLGIKLPKGFKSRLVATSGQEVPLVSGDQSDYKWHPAPDGGACFPTENGGWVYVSNSEVDPGGGAGALRFSPEGDVEDAYPILRRTRNNCAGGPSPWNTWFSCEEVDRGKVFECQVTQPSYSGLVCDGLGWFKHEAVAFDPKTMVAYLTEDERDGCFYRFRPNYPQPSGYSYGAGKGVLEVAEVQRGGLVRWHKVPSPNPSIWQKPTRKQVPEATIFRGGEGIWFHEGALYFTTKHDNRVWVYHQNKETIGICYDLQTSKTPILSGVDNVVVAGDGTVIVAEDGGDMQLVTLDPMGYAIAFLQVVGQDHSELTGPAFSPEGDRLYFSSQKGGKGRGLTYEITGPFLES